MLIGKLIGTLGMERQAAIVVAGFIMSGGVEAAAAMFPFIAPFIITIQGITAIAGISALVGF